MRRANHWINGALLLAAVFSFFCGSPVRATAAGAKQDYSVTGQWVEGCSCIGICTCEMTGLEMGCAGVGAIKLDSGSYMGTDLSGVKLAYATMPGHWVRLYVDTANPGQRQAAKAFARAVYTPFGKIEAVKDAKIDLAGSGGHYRVSVNGGRTMRLSTMPVLGGDKTTPITHTNVKDMLNPTMMQGKTVSGTYRDGSRSMTLKGSNSFFNDKMESNGKI